MILAWNGTTREEWKVGSRWMSSASLSPRFRILLRLNPFLLVECPSLVTANLPPLCITTSAITITLDSEQP